MQISIVNHTNGRVTDEELQQVIRAINRQITEDFSPYWGMNATMRLEGRSVERPDAMKTPDLRGDAVIYLWDQMDVDDALGYHAQNARGIPFGFVFTALAQRLGEHWSVTLSHEALELIADPETNLLAMGPHPSEKRDVFHWFEMCDAVQNETYTIDGIAVSNFVLPLYFTGTRDVDEVGARNDFLGLDYGGQTLKSFGINPGGYVGFFDPELGDHDTFTIRGDAIALMRMEQKGRAKETRRAVRYRSFKQREALRMPATNGRPKPTAATARAAIGTSKAASLSEPAKRLYSSTRTASSPSISADDRRSASATRKPRSRARSKRTKS